MDPLEIKLKARIVCLLNQLDKSVEAQGDLSGPLKSIRNMIIGNKVKKGLFLEADLVPRLLAVVMNNPDMEAKVLATTIIGSLAYGGQKLIPLLNQYNLFDILLTLLESNDTSLIDAACRTLKTISLYDFAAKSHVFQAVNLNNCIALLSDRHLHDSIGTNVASLLANCCSSIEHQTALESASALPLAARMLSGPAVKSQEAALSLIAAMTKGNYKIGLQLATLPLDTSPTTGLALVQSFAKGSRPSTQLIALSCLANLYCSHVRSDVELGMSHMVIPAIIKLLSEVGTVQEKAPILLVYLVSNDESLQKTALEAGAVKKLTQIVTMTDCDKNGSAERQEKLLENCLLAMASLALKKEESRKQIVESKVLPQIVAALSSSFPSVRIAACLCTRSLSRSVRSLRSTLLDAGIAEPLLKLLSDELIEVRTNACATICNIVMGFSSMKKTVIDMGGIELITNLVHSMDSSLRNNAVWALKNLLYQSETSIKQMVMEKLTFPVFQQLLDDSEVSVQENAISLLRNLTCGNEKDLDDVFAGLGESNLFDILERKLGSDNEELKNQSLYSLANISSGNDKHKSAIMSRTNILTEIIDNLDSAKPLLKVASIWCIINLTWQEDSGSGTRVTSLRSYDVEAKLKNLVNDTDYDVKDRAKTALSHFQAVVDSSTGTSSTMMTN